MIPFNFEYIVPDTIDEAVTVFQEINAQGKKPLYYSGGTEIITMGRVNNLNFDAVIDIKKISECNVQQVKDGKVIIGAGLSLKAISLANLFPLLTLAVSRIADHTAQCKITLGGNVAGTVIYHESVLPLLLANAKVLVAGPNGNRTVRLLELYKPAFTLKPGEFLVQFSFAEAVTKKPYVHAKHTEGEKIGYPLVTLCGLKANNAIMAAASGIQAYPCMLGQVTASVKEPDKSDIDNPPNGTINSMAEQMLGSIAQPLMTDSLSSGEFRLKLLKDSVVNMLERLVAAP